MVVRINTSQTRVVVDVDDFDAEIQAGDRRPDHVRADAPLAEVVGRAEAGAELNASIRTEHVLTDLRGPVVTQTTSHRPSAGRVDVAIDVVNSVSKGIAVDAEVAESAVGVGSRDPSSV